MFIYLHWGKTHTPGMVSGGQFLIVSLGFWRSHYQPENGWLVFFFFCDLTTVSLILGPPQTEETIDG
jgi:hypothetical protein